jgi:hypothetical protein
MNFLGASNGSKSCSSDEDGYFFELFHNFPFSEQTAAALRKMLDATNAPICGVHNIVPHRRAGFVSARQPMTEEPLAAQTVLQSNDRHRAVESKVVPDIAPVTP